MSCQLPAAGAALAMLEQRVMYKLAVLTYKTRQTSCSVWGATSRHAAARGHCDRRQLHYCKFLSDKRLSANVLQHFSSICLELSANICSELWLWHYLKLHLKLICSLLFSANCFDLFASTFEAMAPWRSMNRVLYCIVLHCTPGVKKDRRYFSFITLQSVRRFSKFFHFLIQPGICNKLSSFPHTLTM